MTPLLPLLLALVACLAGSPAAMAAEGRWPPLRRTEAEALAAAQGDAWRQAARTADHLLSPAGRERVRRRAEAADPGLADRRQALLATARLLAAQPLPAYRTPQEVAAAGQATPLDSQQELWMRPLGDQLVLLAAAAAIGPDAPVERRLHDLALALCRFPTWGASSWARDQDLAAAHVARGLAVAWAWHRSAWTGAEREEIREAVRQRVGTLCAGAFGGVFWSGAYQENHNQVDMAAVGMCGLAFLDDLPDEAPLWLAAARLDFDEVARRAHPDGSSPEGVPYWTYGASFLLQWLESMRGVLDIGPFYHGGWMRAMANFRLHSSTCGYQGTIAWGDAPYRDYYGPHHILHRLAAEYGDRGAQHLAARLPFAPRGGPDVPVWDWLWYDPAVAEEPPERLDAHFADLDVVVSRSGWGPGDYLVALKAGFTNRNHSHLDAGAIAFAFGGTWLIPTPGYGRGSGQPGFWDASGPRWDFLSNATESHSTLVIDGLNQRHDPDARGTVAVWASAPDGMWTEIDLGQAYHGTRSAWRRAWHRRGDYLLLLDDVELAAPGRIEWLLQAPPQAQIAGPGLTASATAGSLAVRLLDGGGLSARTPASPHLDVSDATLSTWACSRSGTTASFRALLQPRAAGDADGGLAIGGAGDDRWRIAGDGWTDTVAFRADGAAAVAAGGAGARGRLVAIRQRDGEAVALHAAMAGGAMLPCLRPAGAATTPFLAAARLRPGLWLVEGWPVPPEPADGWTATALPAAHGGGVLLGRDGLGMADYRRWRADRPHRSRWSE